ncbi:MAG: rod shape-determining protein MreD [Prevotella sp.]|nr:rod shape-determining protein MreD [Prevotella sp.]MDY6131443.1 rod shape-determining protein MreD [Prevotella sp.]
MTTDVLKRLLMFVILGLVQVLVCNHIHLLGYATPLLYVYFVITFRRNYPKWAILLWSFSLGLSIDAFSNTPGLAAGSMTLLAVVQPYLLEAFVPRDCADDLESSMSALGFTKFSLLTALCVFLYTFVFFTLEVFNFFNWQQWLLCIGGSTVLTIVLVLVLENVRHR